MISRHLTLNRSLNRYVKRIGGKVYYFGARGASLADALRELDAFLREREDQAGGATGNAIPVEMLAEFYARDCETRVANNTLASVTWRGYEPTVDEFVASLPARIEVAQLTPAHFRPCRERWGRLSAPACARYVRVIRTMFQWGVDHGHLLSTPRYGTAFDVPSKREHRAGRERNDEAHGERIFTPDELTKLQNHPLCDGWLRCCVFLGLNAGMYAKDCSDLTWGEIRKIDDAWCIDRTRAKTKVPQRAPLWPETMALLDTLRRPGRGEDARVFSSPTGGPLVRDDSRTDYLSVRFTDLRKASRVERHGVGFGSLRHTHVTSVGDCGDDNAARRVRGHEISDVSGHYDKLTIARLKRVTDLARERLLSNTGIDPTDAHVLRRRRPRP